MQTKNTAFIQVFSTITIVVLTCMASPFASAEELSLEDELSLEEPSGNSAQQPQQAVQQPKTGSATQEPQLMDELDQLEAQSAPQSISDESNIIVRESEIPPDAISEVDLDSDGKQVEHLEQDYLMNGYSIGGTLFNHNYNVYANLLINSTLSFDISKRTADLQSMGLVGRYAVLPYDKIGTDLNFTFATTLNHASANTSPIHTLRGELNLGYAFRTGKQSSFYVIGGLGYELSYGSEIENILAPAGSSFQLGGGLGLGKKINFEFLYSYVKHAISESYLKSASAAAIAAGATTAIYNKNDASVVTNMLLARVIYSY